VSTIQGFLIKPNAHLAGIAVAVKPKLLSRLRGLLSVLGFGFSFKLIATESTENMEKRFKNKIFAFSSLCALCVLCG
jgi:hypothetical protein